MLWEDVREVPRKQLASFCTLKPSVDDADDDERLGRRAGPSTCITPSLEVGRTKPRLVEA